MNESNSLDTLNILYNKAINGMPGVSKSIFELKEEYLTKNESVQDAAKSFINYQIVKCGTSGFLTGLGGLVTLPLSLPANVGSVIYMQLRMITTIAALGGFDIQSDQVQTLSYVCLTGTAATDIFKQAGIKIGEKITENLIKKIPSNILISINKKVGFRLFTKFGTKGAVNFAKMIPLAGGFVGGAVDVASTKLIAKNAYNLFIMREITDIND